MKQVCLLFILMCPSLHSAEGISLPQCESDVIEINMASSSNNEVRCEGVPGTERIRWEYTVPGSANEIIRCEPSGTCDSSTIFNAARTAESTYSTLTPSLDVKKFRAVYGAMTITCLAFNTVSGTISDQISCQLDVVHTSEVTSCSARFNTAPGTSWTVSGSCDVTKAFSQRGRYSCQWKENFLGTSADIVSTVNMTGSPVEDGVTYRSMTCDFSKPLPLVTGNYTYTVVISPGAVQPDVNFAGSSSIALPTASTSCPVDYVKEGEDVDCTCNSINGNPDGSAEWRIQPPSSRLLLRDVRRGSHGNSYVCEVRWGSQVVSSSNFTLQVAYGPDNVTITGPQQPFDTDGTKDMTLTCSAGPSRPEVTYQWRRVSGGTVVNGNQLPLNNVGKSDDGDVIECTAVNTKFSAALRASRSLTLDLHYPPTEAPVIRSSSSQSFVNQGDPLTLTCSVTGGKPVDATTLIFDCPDKQDSNDVHNSAEVNSSVTFDSVVASDNGRVCTCRGQWKTYSDWYTPQAQTTVVVHYAPSSPSIHPGSQPYPFLAGESRDLYCNYPAGADPGNPKATLTLNGHAGGMGQGQVNVTLGDLSSTDNGRRMVCKASNQFTIHTNTRVTTETLLQVYYPPVISVTSLPSDTCSLSTSSSSVTCVVMEGQRVKVNCTAYSNPSVKTISWQPGGDNVVDLQAERGTEIDHTCHVTTDDDDGRDSRLPLNSSAELVVLVQYKANVSQFTVDGDVTDRAVFNESDTISLNCTAKGRPTAGILLKKNGKVIGQRDVGNVTRDDVALLDHTRQRAQCEDAGLYTCRADNEIGDADEHDVKVFVNCRPRLTHPDDDTLFINYLGQTEVLPFSLTTYPVPENNTLHFIGLFGNSSGQDIKPARKDMYNVTCKPIMDMPTTSTNCTLTILSATNNDKGRYNLTLENNWGHASITIILDVNGTETPSKGSVADFPIGAVGAGVGAAVAVIVIMAVVIIFVRRKREKNEEPRRGNSLHQQHNLSNEDDAEMIVNELYGTTGSENNEMIVNELYGTTGSENKAFQQSPNDTSQRNAYEYVDLSGAKQLGTAALPGQKTESVADDVYASVNKGKGPQGACASTAPANDAYSTLDKTRKQSASSAAVLKSSNGKKLKPAVKEKPSKKSTPEKKQGRKNRKQNDDIEYSNAMPLSMSPPEAQQSVYENFAFQERDVCKSNNVVTDKEGQFPSTNPDGLVYTTVAFTDEQIKKAEQPPPERDVTEYVDIDFTRNARLT